MPADVLGTGPERGAPAPARRRAVAVVLAVLAAVGALVLPLPHRGDEPSADPRADEDLRPLPRVLLDRAGVVAVRAAPDGVLHLEVAVQGLPGARLLSLDVELPGSAVVLQPTPDRLDDGTALLALEALPRCPEALPGLSRGALTAVVRGREGARVRQVRVRLDTAGQLADAVRARCGPVAGVPDLRTSPVELEGPAGEPLRTRVQVSASGGAALSVVAVRPGPGLRTTVRTPLPLRVAPGPPIAVRVDVRPGGCGGAPDTPPYVLVLAGGEVVAASVAPAARPALDALRPYRCAG